VLLNTIIVVVVMAMVGVAVLYAITLRNTSWDERDREG
jgi:hypothetical protein